MQLGNEWNAFLIKASASPPTCSLDFEFVMSQIKKGKPPIPFLPDSFSSAAYAPK